MSNKMSVLSLERQREHLHNVSRSFALTIPFLPSELEDIIGNAYLLFRIVDTIEDDPCLSVELKEKYLNDFISLISSGFSKIDEWVMEVSTLLKNSAKDTEYDLITDTKFVLERTFTYSLTVQSYIYKAVAITCKGMVFFLKNSDINTQSKLDKYCYYVAGVVGEMLASIFNNYIIEKSKKDLSKTELMFLAISFGQGLQLTNILKDIYEDKSRGVFWLNINFEDESRSEQIRNYVSLTATHIRNALQFILLIPKEFYRIRKFCFISVIISVKTLSNIYNKPLFSSARDIKISRNELKKFLFLTNFFIKNDTLLKCLFYYYLDKNIKLVNFDLYDFYEQNSEWYL
ncbi:MAG: squalene/phytoene synthase family protein [Succinivibrionaceae bacterium]